MSNCVYQITIEGENTVITIPVSSLPNNQSLENNTIEDSEFQAVNAAIEQLSFSRLEVIQTAVGGLVSPIVDGSILKKVIPSNVQIADNQVFQAAEKVIDDFTAVMYNDTVVLIVPSGKFSINKNPKYERALMATVHNSFDTDVLKDKSLYSDLFPNGNYSQYIISMSEDFALAQKQQEDEISKNIMELESNPVYYDNIIDANAPKEEVIQIGNKIITETTEYYIVGIYDGNVIVVHYEDGIPIKSTHVINELTSINEEQVIGYQEVQNINISQEVINYYTQQYNLYQKSNKWKAINLNGSDGLINALSAGNKLIIKRQPHLIVSVVYKNETAHAVYTINTKTGKPKVFLLSDLQNNLSDINIYSNHTQLFEDNKVILPRVIRNNYGTKIKSLSEETLLFVAHLKLGDLITVKEGDSETSYQVISTNTTSTTNVSVNTILTVKNLSNVGQTIQIKAEELINGDKETSLLFQENIVDTPALRFASIQKPQFGMHRCCGPTNPFVQLQKGDIVVEGDAVSNKAYQILRPIKKESTNTYVVAEVDVAKKPDTYSGANKTKIAIKKFDSSVNMSNRVYSTNDETQALMRHYFREELLRKNKIVEENFTTTFINYLEESFGLPVFFEENSNTSEFAYTDGQSITINLNGYRTWKSNTSIKDKSLNNYLLTRGVHELSHLMLGILRVNNPEAYRAFLETQRKGIQDKRTLIELEESIVTEMEKFQFTIQEQNDINNGMKRLFAELLHIDENRLANSNWHMRNLGNFMTTFVKGQETPQFDFKEIATTQRELKVLDEIKQECK